LWSLQITTHCRNVVPHHNHHYIALSQRVIFNSKTSRIHREGKKKTCETAVDTTWKISNQKNRIGWELENNQIATQEQITNKQKLPKVTYTLFSHKCESFQELCNSKNPVFLGRTFKNSYTTNIFTFFFCKSLSLMYKLIGKKDKYRLAKLFFSKILWKHFDKLCLGLWIIYKQIVASDLNYCDLHAYLYFTEITLIIITQRMRK
jgi:hypothetical protein